MDRIRVLLLLPLLAAPLFSGCGFVNDTRDTLATSYGFIIIAQQQNLASCQAAPTQAKCVAINKAIAVQNLAIDALNAYCSGTPPAGAVAWTAGGPCDPVNTLQSALTTAIANLNVLIPDIKTLAQGAPAPVPASWLGNPLKLRYADVEHAQLEDAWPH